MENLIIAGVLILGYIVPLLALRRFLILAYYHPKGKWPSLEPVLEDLIFCFLPGVNILVTIVWFSNGWKKEEHRCNNTWFFKHKPFK